MGIIRKRFPSGLFETQPWFFALKEPLKVGSVPQQNETGKNDTEGYER